jgi:hypothetical protein
MNHGKIFAKDYTEGKNLIGNCFNYFNFAV